MDKHELELVETNKAINDLTELANQAIEAYTNVAPKLDKITEKLLDKLSQDDELDNMPHEDMLKLLALSTKNQLAPITELTKLTQNLIQLHDRRDIEKTKSDILNFAEELDKAKITAKETTTIEAFANTIIDAELED